MDNLRRLAGAWLVYAGDAGGRLIGNYNGGFVPAAGGRERPWMTGWMSWAADPDVTNRLYVTEARYAGLSPILGPALTFHKCPADNYLADAQAAKGWAARVRSYAMNCYVGEGNSAAGPVDQGYTFLRSLADFTSLPPQQTWVITEEHPDSINDGALFVRMDTWLWADLPGSNHDGAGWFAYADGHVEPRAWSLASTRRPVEVQWVSNVSVPVGDTDLMWLRSRTTTK